MIRHSVSVLLVVTATVLTTRAGAVTTQSFVLDSAAQLSAGDLEGTSVRSGGTVTQGASTKRVPLEDVPVAYSLARGSGGAVFIGTGTDGKIYRLKGSKLRPYADTEQLVVSALAVAWDGTLYAGTLPEGRVFAIEGENKVRELVRLIDTEHVWALVYDRARNKLIAGTGPNGKVVAIDRKGGSKDLYTGNASHIMSLALGERGDIFAGTSDDALVVRIPERGSVRVVHDFPGNEITALAYRAGVLAVVANEFAGPPGVPTPPPATDAAGPSAANGPPPPAQGRRPRPGKGRLWSVDAEQRVEQLLSDDDGHFTVVEWDKKGSLYVGSGKEGRIFKVANASEHAIWIDVEERQVLALDVQEDPGIFVTGDSAAVYTIDRGAPKKAIWTSRVLDAKFVAEWGRVTWRGTGKLSFDTRSGNTEEPDDTWSSWSSANRQGLATSPAARFVQVRAHFPKSPGAELRAVELFYLARNQRGRVDNVRLKPAPPRPDDSATKRSTKYSLAWDVDNPDNDTLRFRLRFRNEGQSVWRDVFTEDVTLTKNEYEWETDSIPDGYYVVRVDASDEPSNPTDFILRATADSEPILIDNHAPTIEKLAHKGKVVTGRALDSLGPIAALEYAVDGGRWQPAFPNDRLLDSANEAFSIRLEAPREGSHIVAVRVTDAAQNQSTAEITIKTGR